MAVIPEVLKNGLSADTVYPTDSPRTIIKKLENNHYIVSMINGSKSLYEIYMAAKEKFKKKEEKIEPEPEKPTHSFF